MTSHRLRAIQGSDLWLPVHGSHRQKDDESMPLLERTSHRSGRCRLLSPIASESYELPVLLGRDHEGRIHQTSNRRNPRKYSTRPDRPHELPGLAKDHPVQAEERGDSGGSEKTEGGSPPPTCHGSPRQRRQTQAVVIVKDQILRIKPGKIYSRKETLKLFLALRHFLDIILANVIESGRSEFTSEEILDLLHRHQTR